MLIEIYYSVSIIVCKVMVSSKSFTEVCDFAYIRFSQGRPFVYHSGRRQKKSPSRELFQVVG